MRGKQHKQSLKTTDLPETKRKLREFRRDLEHTTPQGGRTTFGEVAAKYLLTIRGQSVSTQQNKGIMLKKALAQWEDTAVRDLKKSDLLKWLAGLGRMIRIAFSQQVSLQRAVSLQLSLPACS